jgi:hypothetical protein
MRAARRSALRGCNALSRSRTDVKTDARYIAFRTFASGLLAIEEDV